MACQGVQGVAGGISGWLLRCPLSTCHRLQAAYCATSSPHPAPLPPVHPPPAAGFLLGRGWVPTGLAGSVALSSSGFVLQTCGLKEGSTVVVCTCAAVSSMVMGVAVGLLGLGEPLPHGWAATLVRWVGV